MRAESPDKDFSTFTPGGGDRRGDRVPLLGRRRVDERPAAHAARRRLATDRTRAPRGRCSAREHEQAAERRARGTGSGLRGRGRRRARRAASSDRGSRGRSTVEPSSYARPIARSAARDAAARVRVEASPESARARSRRNARVRSTAARRTTRGSAVGDLRPRLAVEHRHVEVDREHERQARRRRPARGRGCPVTWPSAANTAAFTTRSAIGVEVAAGQRHPPGRAGERAVCVVEQRLQLQQQRGRDEVAPIEHERGERARPPRSRARPPAARPWHARAAARACSRAVGRRARERARDRARLGSARCRP